MLRGVEPEGMEFASFDGTPFMFMHFEGGSVVGVYDILYRAIRSLNNCSPQNFLLKERSPF
jgi:hypothetical protein